jgi:hypothetical protein
LHSLSLHFWFSILVFSQPHSKMMTEIPSVVSIV